MKVINGNIIYCATPFRMENQTERICDFVERNGHFPLHPFNAMPMRRYNYNRYSKALIFRACFWLVDMSEEVWIFGVGSGSFKEYERAKEKGKATRSFVKVFDSSWEEWSQRSKYRKNFGDLVDEVLERRENI